jgi:hypothetical protein
MDATVELLDRQFNFLLKQPDDASFLIEVEPFLRALRDDDRLASYLDDLRDELVRVIQVLEQTDAELVPELIELRNELVTLRPEADDSGAAPPAPPVGGTAPNVAARFAYQQTLAYFDERAGAEPDSFNHRGQGGKASALLAVLQAKDSAYLRGEEEEAARRGAGVQVGEEAKEANASPDDACSDDASAEGPLERTDLDRWRTRVGNVDRRLNHVRRWFRLRIRTSAGVALLKLEAARDAMQPPLKLVDPDEGAAGLLGDMLRLVGSSDYSLLKVADEDRLDDADVHVITERVADLRSSAQRLHEELRRRIGATRSRLALVHRFKLRCEWHDRERMVAVAEDKTLGGGGPEDRLTAEFARYLFDQGLSPLSKPMTGGLQPDLLDPAARFYVEAKQYDSSARGDIVSAVAQVMDTVGRLRGSQYDVDEAFCVVFRRKGPYYDLPNTLHTQSYRLHLVLVDLAPADETGRRQREKPSVIEAAEFFAAEAELDHAGTVEGPLTAGGDTVGRGVEAPVDQLVDIDQTDEVDEPAGS